MRVRMTARVHFGQHVFYEGDVVETSKYPGLEEKLAMLGNKTATAPRDKMARTARVK